MTKSLTRGRALGAVGAVALSATMLLAAGCGGDSSASAKGAGSSSDTIAPVQSGVVKVNAIDNFFKDENVTVTAGSKVVWTNVGRNDHNVKPVDGGDFGIDTADFKPGASYSATFSTPGTYHYYCTIHGTSARGMVGTIQVVAP